MLRGLRALQSHAYLGCHTQVARIPRLSYSIGYEPLDIVLYHRLRFIHPYGIRFLEVYLIGVAFATYRGPPP